jgi:hypothetical protein
MNLKLLSAQPSRDRARDEQPRVRAGRKGDRPAAIRLQRQSLAMSRHELGSDHPDVAGGAANLAYWLISTGEYADGAPARREPRDPSQGARSGHPQVASTLTVRQPAGCRSGTRARDVARDALRILAVHVPDDHWQVAMARNAEGAA